MTLIFLCLGWLAGIYLGLAYGAGVDGHLILQEVWPYLGALAVLSLLAGLLGRNDRPIRLTALALTCAILGIWRSFASLPDPAPPLVPDGVATVHGVVSDRPEPRDASLQLVMDVDRVKQNGTWTPTTMRLLVRTDRFEDWSYGDVLSASGELHQVQGLGYWATWLSRQGIYSTMEYPRLQREATGGGLDLMGAVNRVRDRLQNLCSTLLPEPQASLLSGILVGGRRGMPQGFRDALNSTSTSHLVAVSGFNVTVVAGAVQLLALRFLSRRKAALLAVAAVWGYALLTGLPPSAVRAAIMATMALASVIVGRDSDSLSFLALSAAVMTWFDPFLLFDLGFQLSFLATAGLILLEPALRSWIARVPGPIGRTPGWLASSFTVTMAAQLATLPVLAATFHTVSLVSPLTNLLLAPILTGLMATGALAVSVGALAEALGRIVAPLAWVYLTYMVEVVERTSLLPSASIPVGNLDFLEMGSYYLVLLSVALWPLPEFRTARERVPALLAKVPRLTLVVGGIAAISLVLLVGASRSDDKVHVYFLDVGHGDATLIRTPSGRSVLVDGGPSPTSVESAMGRHVGFLERDLDAIVLTGYQQDRLTGAMEVARRHGVGLVLQPGRAEGNRGAAAWAELLAERQIAAVKAEAGQRVDLGDGSYLEVVWASLRDDKDPSMAVALVTRGVRVLLPGDLPAGTDRTLGGDVSVLRVPRQGAAGALDDSFLRATSPRVAILSVAANNRFGHPADTTLQQLKSAKLFRTDRDGTIELAIGSEGYEVYTER